MSSCVNFSPALKDEISSTVAAKLIGFFSADILHLIISVIIFIASRVVFSDSKALFAILTIHFIGSTTGTLRSSSLLVVCKHSAICLRFALKLFKPDIHNLAYASLMISRKKDFEKAVDKFGKEVHKLTSELPEGSATDQFVDSWKVLRKRFDGMKDKLPTS
jgi:hypothetical protein